MSDPPLPDYTLTPEDWELIKELATGGVWLESQLVAFRRILGDRDPRLVEEIMRLIAERG